MDKKALIRQLKVYGFSEKIISSFERVPREIFIPSRYQSHAYEDIALPIDHLQTISQPYTIAFMLSLLSVGKNQKILEIGSGSGYVLALLAAMAPNAEIHGVERIRELVDSSRTLLSKQANITIHHADGSRGLAKFAPFDRILVSAASDDLPQILLKQLKFKGALVAPVGHSIIRIQKEVGENKVTEYPGFVFVPLLKGTR